MVYRLRPFNCFTHVLNYTHFCGLVHELLDKADYLVMAYPELSEKETDGINVEMTDLLGGERRQIGFDDSNRKKLTTPTTSTSDLLPADQSESRPRLNSAERVSIFHVWHFLANYMNACWRGIKELKSPAAIAWACPN